MKPGREPPLVSVLMVTYGRAELALEAIAAIRATTDAPHEVIVVDNASADGTADTLEAQATGIRLIRNRANAGFGAGINRAALEARGRYLCILNSDAIVRPGWLPPMLERFEDPTIGAVVPLYLNDDGTVQEAGSSVGSDGWTWAHGRGLNPDAPEIAFPREVDFGSAACVLVRRETFVAVGGFHPAYGIGYYEDVDLCLTLRCKGLRTVFEPRSRVLHAGEASSDHASAVARMAANRETFLARWGDALAARPKLGELERFPHRVVHARDAGTPIRVLVVQERLPASDPAGNALLGLLTRLAPGTRVTVLAREVDPPTAAELAAAGVEVLAEPADLAARAFHTTAVVVRGAAAAVRMRDVVERAQPQAALVYDMGAAPAAAMLSRFRSAEVWALRRASAILAPTPEHARFARDLAPGTPVVVTDPDPRAAALRALAHAGLANGGRPDSGLPPGAASARSA